MVHHAWWRELGRSQGRPKEWQKSAEAIRATCRWQRAEHKEPTCYGAFVAHGGADIGGIPRAKPRDKWRNHPWLGLVRQVDPACPDPIRSKSDADRKVLHRETLQYGSLESCRNASSTCDALVNRRVRTRTHGGVGAWGGQPPPATRCAPGMARSARAGALELNNRQAKANRELTWGCKSPGGLDVRNS